MNKLGYYIQATVGIPGLVEAIREVRPPTLLTHANDRGLLQTIRRDLSPETFVVGRLHLDVHDQDVWLAGDGERAGRGEWLDDDAARSSGRAFAERVLDHDFGMATERYPNEPGGRLLIDVWMSLNECLPGPMSDDWQKGSAEEREKLRAKARALDAFQVGFRERLQEEGLEAVAFNFGAGNFQKAEHYLDWFPRTLGSYIYLGFHEYGWPTLYPDAARGTESAACLYRDCMEGIQKAFPGREYKVIITEAGLARMYHHAKKEAGDVGWLYEGETISEDDYLASLSWYNEQLGQDDYVLGACLFNVGPEDRWKTFRHLGVDNKGVRLGIVDRIRDWEAPRDLASAEEAMPVILEGRITSGGKPVGGAEVRLLGSPHTLGADSRAVAYDPTGSAWTRSITGFGGSLWNTWQKLVAPEVSGLSYEEFKGEVVDYNPSLAESGGRLKAGEVYLFPEARVDAAARGLDDDNIVWDRQLTGFSGHRWACWCKYVRGKVQGLDWNTFMVDVVTKNEGLVKDGYVFRASKSYLLPRNAGQYEYTRVAHTDAQGRYRLAELPPGRFDLEVRAEGYRQHRQVIDLDADTTLNLALEAVPVVVVPTAGPFVTVRGRQFAIEGRPFRFIGVNLRGLAHYGMGKFDIAAQRVQLKHAHEMKVRVVRLFLAHKEAPQEEIATRLARTLDLLRSEYPQMYLVPAFTDLYINSEMYPQGDDGYYESGPGGAWTILGARWFSEGYKQNYLPLVRHIVGRKAFRNEPQILAWEIGNELKLDGKPGQFIKFNQAVADEIRSLDPNHLITTGMMSTAHAGLNRDQWTRLYSHANLDFITCHIYNADYRDDDSKVGVAVNKPFIVEEAGFDGKPGDNRAEQIKRDMDTMLDNRRAAGYMQWGFMAEGDNRDGDRDRGMDWVYHSDWNDLFGAYKERAERL
jgi:hypothetical protein